MSQTNNATSVRATLELIFRSGTYGLFPVGTLRTNIGTFACRDEWLEALDEGSYEGEFDIEEIKLCSYITKNYVPEVRCYNRAVVTNYHLDNMSDEVQPTEFEFLDDPILEEQDTTARTQKLEPEAETKATTEDVHLPDWLKDDNDTPEPHFSNETPEEVYFIREKLRSTGNNTEWNIGDEISIPSEINRIDQRTIVQFLKDNGYSIIDPNNRTWGILEVDYA